MCAFNVADGAVQIVNALVGGRVAEVVLVQDREEPMGTHCVFCENRGPVSFVLLHWFHVLVDFLHVVPGEQGLQFRAEAVSFFDADLGFHHMNVGVDNAFVVGGDRGGQRVEVKVEVGVFGFKAFGELLADVKVDVADVECASRVPAVPFVTVDRAIHSVEVGGVQAACGGVLEADFGAVLAAELALSRDGVKHFGRPANFPLYYGCVWVERGRQVVGVLFGDGGDVVHWEVKQLQISVGAELHVVDAFESEVDAQAFGGPAGIEQNALSLSIGIPVVGIGVVDFLNVFAHELEPPFLDLGAIAPGTHVLWELQDQSVLGHGASGLKAADKAGTEGDPSPGCGQSVESVVQIDLPIEGTDDAGAVDQPRIKVQPLFAHESFDSNSGCGLDDHAEPIECIVDAEVSFFVSPKDQAGSELFIEVSKGDFKLFFVVLRIAVTNTRPSESTGISQDGVEVALVPHACSKVASGVDEVAKGVKPRFTRWHLSANQGVFLIGLEEELDVACDLPFIWVTLAERNQRQNQCQRQERENVAHDYSASFMSSSYSSSSSPSA